VKFPKPYTEFDNYLNVIIETPVKSRNKYDYDEKTGLFKLKKVIPSGLQFPCDMGFIPGTIGEDGDPLDVLVFMSDFSYPGVLIECRLLGVMKIEQTQNKKTIRNDRFLAVPIEAHEFDHLKKINDVDKDMIDAIMNFFSYYNEKENKILKLAGVGKAKEAHKLIKHAM
jgi:inorganic pyrophosphatase